MIQIDLIKNHSSDSQYAMFPTILREFSCTTLTVVLIVCSFSPALGQKDNLTTVEVIDHIASEESDFQSGMAAAKAGLRKRLKEVSGTEGKIVQGVLDTLRQLEYKRTSLADTLAESRAQSIQHAKKAQIFARFNQKVLGAVQGLITPKISRFFKGWGGFSAEPANGEAAGPKSSIEGSDLDSMRAQARQQNATLDSVQSRVEKFLDVKIDKSDLLEPINQEIDSVQKRIRRQRKRAQSRSVQQQEAIGRVGARLAIKARKALHLAEEAGRRANRHLEAARRYDHTADSLGTTHQILRKAEGGGDYTNTDDLDDIVDQSRE